MLEGNAKREIHRDLPQLSHYYRDYYFIDLSGYDRINIFDQTVVVIVAAARIRIKHGPREVTHPRS